MAPTPEPTMTDIHNTQERLQSAINSLENCDLSEEELQALKDFKLQLESEGISLDNFPEEPC